MTRDDQVAPGRICVSCLSPFWPKSKDRVYDQCDGCYRGYEPSRMYEIA